MTSTSTVLVVGASVASAALISQLRDDGFSGRIQVLDHDLDAPYDRPPLSKEFLGTTSVRPEASWWDDRCELAHVRALSLDVNASTVRAIDADGAPHTFNADHIVLATGSTPIRLPNEPGGIAHLRTAADARYIRQVTTAGRKVVILGAGTVGTELASSLIDHGCDVTVIDQADRPLARFFGGHLGAAAAAWIEQAGVTLALGSTVDRIERQGEEWVVATSTASYRADVVISAVGTRPATGWLQDTPLDLRNGVCCDNDGTALDSTGRPIPTLHAIGDVSAWTSVGMPPRRYEDWTTAQRQGRHLARHLLGLTPTVPFDQDPPYFWSHQFGRKIQVLGTPEHEGRLVQQLDDPARNMSFYTIEHDGRTVARIAINAPVAFAKAMRESLRVSS